jgi:hypothetical protein
MLVLLTTKSPFTVKFSGRVSSGVSVMNKRLLTVKLSGSDFIGEFVMNKLEGRYKSSSPIVSGAYTILALSGGSFPVLSSINLKKLGRIPKFL